MTRATKRPKSKTVHVLRVRLKDIKPSIWRELSVPSDTRLDRLHAAIQAAMPWSNSHLHTYFVGARILTVPYPAYDDEDLEDERKVTLAEVAPVKGAKFVYEYDSGDCWRHEVRVKGIDPLAPGASRTMACLGGARACPPDDCGGSFGYEDLVNALRAQNHKRHKELSGWLTSYRAQLATYDARFEGPWDPEAFDLEAANKAVGKAAQHRRGS